MAPPIKRAYCRETDVGAEGETMLQPGDKSERELSHITGRIEDIDKKTDDLIAEGCSHRKDDLARMYRIEMTIDGFRNDATAIKDSIYQLSLSFEQYKTKVTESNNSTDNKINNLKFGILVQCAILLLSLLVFTFKEFVLPATKNTPSNYSETGDRPRINVDVETWNKMVGDKK